MTAGALLSQTVTDPEEEYSRIRSLALTGKYLEAEPAARDLVKQFPDYGDARVLLGRILAWQGHYDEGAAVIDTLLASDPDNLDAIEALRDIRRWSRDRSQQNTPPTDIRAGYQFDTYSEPYDRLMAGIHPGCRTSLFMGYSRGFGEPTAISTSGHRQNVSDNDLQFAAEAWPELTRIKLCLCGLCLQSRYMVPASQGSPRSVADIAQRMGRVSRSQLLLF
ncbi:MAG: tetratricopeptide repeat protein [Marinilabiliales bacterium]|nr:tetratricopeptide repeat protein [Marinilabiliales bacterium]